MIRSIYPKGAGDAPPNPVLKEMINLIGNMGFVMMGATNICYDNKAYCLEWKMGSGAKCKSVQFKYDIGLDTYTLVFIGATPKKTFIDELIQAEDVISLIEKRSGFYLRMSNSLDHA